MKITKAWLNRRGACSAGVEGFEKSGLTEASEVMAGLLKENRREWANWLIARLLDRKDKIRYAVFAAEQVIEMFEKKYPEDKRPRQAIEAAKAVLKKNNDKTRVAAGDAAVAAWSAWAASGAARDAMAAARAAAWAARVAAWDTWDAFAAARDAMAVARAAWAAGDVPQEKIIRYGMELYGRHKWSLNLPAVRHRRGNRQNS